jgi:hypothetical protein
MVFVLGPKDFDAYGRSDALRDAQIDRINRRKASRDMAARVKNRVMPSPQDPFGQNLGLLPPVNKTRPAATPTSEESLTGARKVRQATSLPTDVDIPGQDIGAIPPGADPDFPPVPSVAAEQKAFATPPPPLTQDLKGQLSQLEDAFRFGKAAPSLPAIGNISRVIGNLLGPNPSRESLAQAKELDAFYRSPQVREIIARDPTIMREIKGDPIAIAKEIQSIIELLPRPAPRNLPPPSATPLPSAAPVLDVGLAVNLIAQLETGNDPTQVNPSSGAKGAMQVLPSTARKPGIKGVTPAKDDSVAESDRVGRELVAAYIKMFPNDPARVAIAYRLGIGSVSEWDDTKTGILKLAKAVGVKKPQQALTYIEDFLAGIRGSQQQVGVQVPVAPGAPAVAAAPVPGVPTTVADTARVTLKNTGRLITAPRSAGIVEGASTIANKVATAPDPTKIQEPSKTMSFTLRSQELNNLMAKRQQFSEEVRFLAEAGAGEEALKAVGALNASTALLENMVQDQAINLMQQNNDPRMLNRLLSQQNRRPIEISFNDDGTVRVVDNGVTVHEYIKKSTFLSKVQKGQSLEFARKMAELKAANNAATQKLQIEALLEIAVANNKGAIDAFIERLKGVGITKGQESDFFIDKFGNVYELALEVSQLTGEEVRVLRQLQPGQNAADFE